MASSSSSRRLLSVRKKLNLSSFSRSERHTYHRPVNYFWVFGYGSLIWRPGFEFASRHIAILPGYSLRFWQGSQHARGQVGKPGRVATLTQSDKNDAWGIAFKVPIENFDKVMLQLDVRERGYTLYTKEVALKPDSALGKWTKTSAAVYIAEDLDFNPEYLGSAPLYKMATTIAHAHGKCGHNSEYLYRTADCMRRLFPCCSNDHIFDLEAAVRAEESQGVIQQQLAHAWTLLAVSNGNGQLQEEKKQLTVR